MARFKRFPATPLLAQDVNNIDIVSAILSSCGPSLLSRSLVGQIGKQSKTLPAFLVAFSRFKVKFAQLALKNRVLENENVILKMDLETTRSEMIFIRGELQAVRGRSSHFKENQQNQTIEADKSERAIKSLETKVEQYGEFIRALVDLKLDNPVKRAALSVMNDQDFEEALVKAVQVACQNKSSAWSRIVPALSGSRDLDDDLPAPDRGLCAEKDKPQPSEQCDVFNSTARTPIENTAIVTPSSSSLSDLYDESSSVMTSIKSPSQVLENMLSTLKRGRSWPPRQEAAGLSVRQPPQPLLLDSTEKDLISESSSILSEEIRNSLHLLPSQSEGPGPHGILKNGVTATTVAVPEKCKDALSPRIVRFAPNEENAIIMRPSSIESTSSSLSYVSEGASGYVIGAGLIESQSRELTHKEENEFSASDSVLSEVYADFLNETDLEDALHGQARTSADWGGFGEPADTSDERPTSPLTDPNAIHDSSESEYSTSEMCDDEDFAPRSSLGQHSTERNTFTSSFTPANNSLHSHSVRGQTYETAKREGLLEHRRLPSIEEEDIGSERLHALRPVSEVFHEVVDTGPSPRDHQQLSIAADSVDEAPSGSFNKRYGRVAICQVAPPAEDTPQSREVPTTLTRQNLSKDISRSVTTTTRSFLIDEDIPNERGNQDAALCLDADIPVRRSAETKRVGVWKVTAPKQSHAQSVVPVTPPRSELVLRRFSVPKRPVLQQRDTNTPAALSSTDDETTHSNSRQIAVKSSAKALGKRRGVIMVEKPDIAPIVRNSPVAEHNDNNHCKDDSDTQPGFSHGRPGPPQSRLYDNPKKNVFEPNPHCQSAQTPTSIMPSGPPSTSARVPMMLSQLEQSLKHMSTKAGADVSRFDSNIAELLNSISSSDLGSLELTEPDDSNSDCEILGALQINAQEFVRGLANSPDAGTMLQTNAAGDESTVATSGTLRNSGLTTLSSGARRTSSNYSGRSRRLPAPAPRGAFKKHSSAPAVASLESESSSGYSSPSSLYVESPTVSRISYRESRLGFARPTARLDKLSPISSKMVSPAERDVALSTLRHKQSEGGSSGTKNPTSIQSTPSSEPSPTLIPHSHGADKVRVGMKLSLMSKAGPSPSKPSGMPKSLGLSPQLRVDRHEAVLPTALHQPKPWPVLGVSGKISPSQVKSKLAPTPAPSSKVPGSIQQNISNTLGPPPTLNNKPRANTINTISPLPPRYHTPLSITPHSPTKPRSNTVNGISPRVRSPLSQTVVNRAVDFQSRLVHVPPLPKCANEAPLSSPVRPLGAKRVEKPGSKSIAPLHIVKKDANASKAREARPPPPTAAFMRPGLSHLSPTVRRVSTSVAPLIPNWGGRDGGLSASQARNMLRSNNVSMR